MAVSWVKMNEEDGRQISLPCSEKIQSDDNHLIEIAYKQNEDGSIERIVRRSVIRKTKKRISKAVKERQLNFVKFGDVKDKAPKFIEKGITEIRNEPFDIQWVGLSNTVKKEKSKKEMPFNLKQERNEEQKLEQSLLENNNNNNNNDNNNAITRKYMAPSLRMRDYDYLNDDELFQIRISNLPQDTREDDIGEMMKNVFYENKCFNLPRYLKVRCFTSKREKERIAIVDLKSKHCQEKAIQLLDNQRYGYCIITVDKARPRSSKRW